VARTVFKIAEVAARRLVGSIPTRSRHIKIPLYLQAFLRHAVSFTTPFASILLKNSIEHSHTPSNSAR
jgi:hypothetical protein